MTPDLESLSDFVSIVDQWEQVGAPLDALFKQILPAVSRTLPEVTALRYYQLHLDDDLLTLAASSGNSTATETALIRLSDHAVYAAAITSSKPLSLGDGAGWVYPLRSEGQPFALLEVTTDPEHVSTPGTANWLNIATLHLAAVLKRHTGSIQVRNFDAIIKLVSGLTTIRDEQAVLEKGCTALFSVTGVDHSTIILANADDDASILISEHPERDTAGIDAAVWTAMQDQLRGQREPVMIRDLDDLPEASRSAFQDAGAKALLLLPILDARGGFLGITCLEIHQPDSLFTAEMVELSQIITAHLAFTLQNNRLLRSARRQTRQLEQIAGFSQSIQAVLDVESLLEVALIMIAQVLPAHYLSIIFYDAPAGQLKTVAWWDEENVHVVPTGAPVANFQGTTIQHVWTSKTPLHINDVQQEDMRHAFRDDIRSVMSMPISARGIAIGVVEIGHTQPAVYSSTDSAVFQQLTAQFAVAVENAETYTQSQRLAKSKILVNDITSQLQQQMDIERILQVTTQELGKALGARKARIRLAPNAINQEDQTE